MLRPLAYYYYRNELVKEMIQKFKPYEPEIILDAKIQTALRIYESQKRANKNYRKKNPEKMRENSNKYYNKMKTGNPEKYSKYLEKCRNRYVPVAERKNALPTVTVTNVEKADKIVKVGFDIREFFI